MVECVVEYDYDAQEEDELTFKIGDIITDVKCQEGGWWEGRFNGKYGVFPDNFVKLIKKEIKEQAPSMSKKDAKHDKVKGHVAALSDKLGKEGGIRIGPPPPGHGALKKENVPNKKRAKVLFSYEPEAEDELKLNIGDIVEILKQEEEGWLEGRLNGKEGMLPSNFVEIIEDTEDQEVFVEEKEPEKPPVESPPVVSHKKPTGGVGLGNIFSEGPVKLRQTQSVKKSEDKHSKVNDDMPKTTENKKKSALSTAGKEPAVIPSRESVKPVVRARVLFSYSAENEDELSLEEGDILTVLNQELEDGGWWQGMLNGKTGVFPDNFVEVLPEERPKKPPPPVVPHSAAPPRPATIKTSERPPAPDPIKPDKVDTSKHKKVEEKPAPSLPSRKPAVPPPIGKKPVKHSDGKSTVQTDDDKAKEKDPDDFDSIEATEKLAHPRRPKGPSKRPPSQVLKDLKDAEEETTPPPVPPPPTAAKRHSDINDTKVHGDGDRRLPTTKPRPPPPTPNNIEASNSSSALPKTPPSPLSPRLKEHSTKSNPISTVTNGVSDEEVALLRREIEHLKETTVSKEAYNDLKQELSQFKDSLNGLKVHFNKRLMELMNEVDEEKKIRLAMQVEVERVKKLAMS